MQALPSISLPDAMLADVWPMATWPGRAELAAAAVIAILVLVLMPLGRRRLAWGPIVFVAAGAALAACAVALPQTRETAAPLVRFAAIASLLQSFVLLVAVAGWERFVRPMPKIFVDVLRWIALAVAILASLWEAGIDAGELLTGSALVTAVLGFALKDTLGNVFAGLAIHAEHPFEIGDWIQYDSLPAHVGRVVEINWRATKVITLDEATVIIPNGQLAQASIRNFTKPEPWSRRSLFVVTPYDVPPQRVQSIILDAVRGSFGVLEHPAPSVVTNDFKERGVEHWVRIFTTAFDQRDRVDGMARDRIWYALARHGIDIPVATQAIRLTQLPLPPTEPPDVAVERRVRCLQGVDLLAALDAGEVRGLASESADRVYGAGEQIIRQGDPGRSMFVVMEGRVEVTAAALDAPPVCIATLEPGDYFGEMSLMTGAPRVATVTATEETRLLDVGRDSFARLLGSRPQLVEQLGAALRRRLVERAEAIAGVERAVPEVQDIFRKIRDFFAM